MCKAIEISDGSVEEMLKELLSHPTLVLKNGVYWKGVVRRTDKINDQSDVLQLATNLLENCLDESEISEKNICIYGKASFTKLCQFGAERKNQGKQLSCGTS